MARVLGRGPVLFVTYSGLWGGAECILLDVACSLGRPAVLMCPEGELARRARDRGLPVLAVPERPRELRGGPRTALSAGAGLAGHARDVRTLAASLRPPAVVAFGMRSAIASAVALSGLPERPALVFEHVDQLPGPPVDGLVRRAAASADLVVALTDDLAGELGPLGERVQVVPPGVDLDEFEVTTLPESPVALLLGAIAPWKRPDLALEVVALAARELPELRLVIAGHPVGRESAGLLERLRERAARPDLAGRVEFAGALPDPRPALAGASCLLHCAEREPFGIVLLEAMASGRPVVAPAAGGPLEIVAEGCGRLYAPGDAAAAAAALVATLTDPDVERTGQRARARVAERYASAVVNERWREATAHVLGSPPPPPPAELTLVTVTHNSEAELRCLLDSAHRHLPGVPVVVVDSGSVDASVEIARERATRVLELDNVGYGRATNAGVAQVETAACVVLNPDVELVDGSLAELAAEALRPGAPERLLAPLVLHPDGGRQDSVHPAPLSAATALSTVVPPAALPGPLGRAAQPWRAPVPRRVAWAVGCCLAARTDTLRRLGPFDERIFMYAEDMELGLRAGEHGVETWWWPAARVIHHEAHSAERAFGGEPFDLLARQRHAVVAEQVGERAARADDALQRLTLRNRIALKTLLRRPAERERRQLTALRAARGARL